MLRSRFVLFLTVVVTTLAGAVAGAQDDTSDLQAILDAFLAQNEMAPGVSAYVVCPRLQLAWGGAAGTMNHGTDEPLTPLHTFRIASNTKTYVAVAILRLSELNRLQLDHALFDWLRCKWKEILIEDGYDIEAMTLRQVLSHTSGLAEHPGDERFGEAIMNDPYYPWTRDELIRLCG